MSDADRQRLQDNIRKAEDSINNMQPQIRRAEDTIKVAKIRIKSYEALRRERGGLDRLDTDGLRDQQGNVKAQEKRIREYKNMIKVHETHKRQFQNELNKLK